MSIKRNFAYSFILTASGYVFPLLTYPYVSRILGVSGIGICDFVDSIINYFILFSMMGIATCGIREIAVHKDNRERRSKIFYSILLLNIISTAIALVILLTAMYTVPALAQYRKLLYIGVLKLIANIFLIEWFYTGMENFAYITKRTIAVKLIYVVAIFVFIRKPEDYSTYYILTVAAIVLNAGWNMIYTRKIVTFSLKDVSIKPLLATFFSMGLYKIITSIYTTMNVTWLGFVTDTDQVGYYTSATKLYTIIISVFTAFTGVMLPRLSALHALGNEEEFWKKIRLSVEALACFSFPVTVFSIIFAPNILHFLLGNGFEGAYLPFRIIAPLVFIIGYEQILVLQILIPRNYDRIVLRNSVIGASLAVLANFLIVKMYGATGSAIVWLSSELAVLTATLLFVCRKTHYTLPLRTIGRYMICYAPLALVLYLMRRTMAASDLIILLTTGSVVLLFTIVIQKYYIKSPVAMGLIEKLRI